MYARTSIRCSVAALAVWLGSASCSVAQRGGGGGGGRSGGSMHAGGFSGGSRGASYSGMSRGGSTSGFSRSGFSGAPVARSSWSGSPTSGMNHVNSSSFGPHTSGVSSAHAAAASNWHNSGAWNQHGGSWANNGNWNGHGHDGHNDWHHDGHDHSHGSWGNSWGWGLGLSFGYGWPGAWGYGDIAYGDSYAGIYPSYYVDPSVYPTTVQALPDAAWPPVVDPLQPTVAQVDQTANPSAALTYFNHATTAFRKGDYRAALRSAAHAGVEDPKNAKPHELASLSLFANEQYRGAAIEAHAALALGPAGDWDAMIGYYGNVVEPFTNQLRALERYSKQDPAAGDARFLLGYLYQGMGFAEDARTQFTEAAKLSPRDEIARKMAGLPTGGTETPAATPIRREVPPNPKPIVPMPR